MNILPRNFEALLTEEREIWKEAQLCMDKISNKFELSPTTKPSIKGFYSLTSKTNPVHFLSWKVKQDLRAFTLSLVQFETAYTSAGPAGGYTHQDRSLYFFGQLRLKKDFGISLIRPETLRDKINELFEPLEVDMEAYPLFNYRYYMIAQQKEKIQNRLPPEFFKFMEKIKGTQIEFRNHQCLFRLPKAVDEEESMQLCLIGLELDEILNRE